MDTLQDSELSTPTLADIRIPVVVINDLLTCGLCHGYLHNAVTITECLHTFCKSCLVRHISFNLRCPKCQILIHPTDPLVNIRHDATLQDILYKLLPQVEQVPDLCSSVLTKDSIQDQEILREKDFYSKNTVPEVSKLPISPRAQYTSKSFWRARRIHRARYQALQPKTIDHVKLQLEFAGKSVNVDCGSSVIKPLRNKFVYSPSRATIGIIRQLLHMQLDLDSSSFQICVFAGTYMLHDCLKIIEVFEVFCSEEKTDALILHYAIMPPKDYFAEFDTDVDDDDTDVDYESSMDAEESMDEDTAPDVENVSSGF